MKKIDICLTPDLIHQFDLHESVAVVIDILRASSTITTAIGNGAESIKLVETPAECKVLKEEGYIAAGERNGKKVRGFDLGNSPYDFINADIEDKKIALTTTNGTNALMKSKGALQVLTGAFLNYSALLAYMEKLPCNVVLVCAGWKGKVNMEDTLFAGAVVHGLRQLFEYGSDAPLMAVSYYRQVRDNLRDAIENSSHVKRLMDLGLERDIDYCLKYDEYKVIPILKGQYITKMKLSDMLF